MVSIGDQNKDNMLSDQIITAAVYVKFYCDIDGLEQNCSNIIANALELPQSCTKPSIYPYLKS